MTTNKLLEHSGLTSMFYVCVILLFVMIVVLYLTYKSAEKKEIEEVKKERERLKAEYLVIEKLKANPEKVIVESFKGSIEEYTAYYKGNIYTAIMNKEKIIKFVKIQ